MNAPVTPPKMPINSLEDRLKTLIKTQGSISVARYMAACLYDPEGGYYVTRGKLGRDGDFITAPEVSQMFGEMLGLWAVQTWMDMGSPAEFNLVELGPGKGTLMADALRAAHVSDAFTQAANITLVESCEPLKTAQRAALAGHKVNWVSRIGDIPDGPMVLLANEYLDCLPIRQFVRMKDGWHERLVGMKDDKLIFGVAPRPITSDTVIPESLRDADEGALVEVRPQAQAVISSLASRFRKHKGMATFIDYGPLTSEVGDTLQAIRNHEKVDAFSTPGDADLSARVDFAELARQAVDDGLVVHGPTEQGTFLKSLGIDIRAAHLIRANRATGAKIVDERDRLTQTDQMGSLFKVITFAADNMPKPTGF